MSNYVKGNWKKILCYFIIGAYFFALNCMTPYVADDFQYMYSFKNGDRITSFFQIFPSLYCHYMNEIGRIVPHFFAQFFLMLPKIFFNIANTIMLLVLVHMLYSDEKNEKPFRLILFILIPILFWQYVPDFGQVFLWEDGCFNYLWSFSFAVLFLAPYISLYLKGTKLSRIWKIVFCIFAFFFGNYSENVSFSTAFISFLVLLFVMREEKAIKQFLYYIYPVIAAAVGYLFMILSPGEASHMSVRTASEVIKGMIKISEQFVGKEKFLISIWAVLMCIAIYYKIDRKRIVLSVLLFLASVIDVVLLGFGSYLANRAFAAGVVFLIWAIFVLIQGYRQKIGETKTAVECLILCMGTYLIVGSLLNVWNGTYDIYETNHRNAAREEFILEQVAMGKNEITVPIIEPATTYCAKYGIADIFTEEQNALWLNKAIAKYYGLDMIYGVRE